MERLTATPAPQAALKISRFLASLSSYLVKDLEMMFATQHAICTNGPSFPVKCATFRSACFDTYSKRDELLTKRHAARHAQRETETLHEQCRAT